MPTVFFYAPWKHNKPSGFVIFLRGIERDLNHKVALVFITDMLKLDRYLLTNYFVTGRLTPSFCTLFFHLSSMSLSP